MRKEKDIFESIEEEQPKNNKKNKKEKNNKSIVYIVIALFIIIIIYALFVSLSNVGLLNFGNKEESLAIIKDRCERRRASQPLDMPSAGSVFKNPEGDHAGRLIEACGLKGKRIGGAEVSSKHANFIVNTGTATSNDIKNLIKLIKDEVKQLHVNENAMLDIMIDMSYNQTTITRAFVWNTMGDVLVENMLNKNNNKIVFPIKDQNGEIKYNGETFKNIEVVINKED